MSFSIIIPCRNDQAGLDRAIQSVLDQTVSNVEVIVIDDGSDTPLTVVDDARVNLFRRDVAGGPAVARNLGLEHAGGAIVGWCDSDDFFEPNRLELAERLHSNADIVVVGQGSASGSDVRATVPASLEAVLDRTSPSLGATTVRRELCLPLDDRYLACEDIDWWIRTINNGGTFRSTAEVGYRFDLDDRVRLLNSPTARLDFSYALLEQHADFYTEHPKAMAFRWLRIAVMEQREGNVALARRALRRSFKAHPTALAAKQAVRLGRASAHLRHGVPSISTRPLPPMNSLRASELVPLVRGTAESRLSYDSVLISATSSVTSRLPKTLRGRARRAATKLDRSNTIKVKTAWGILPVQAKEVRLLAPYADEPLELALLARYLQEGMTAIDIGANRGVYSLMFSARVGSTGSVLSVEPDPRMVARLELVRTLNSLQQVLTIVDAAVAGESGQRQLNLSSEPSLNHLQPNSSPVANGPVATVSAISYLDLLAQHSLDQVELLKVDVEGAEPEVLASVMTCKSEEYLPALIMFEYEPEHWARFGYSSFSPTAQALTARYQLFAIDYASGRLLPIDVSDRPAWTGRNVLAVSRTRSSEILRRLAFTKTTDE